MLVAVAAMAFTACTETNDEVNANVEKRVFKFVAGFADDTRSGFNGETGKNEYGKTTYKSSWDGDEWLKVYANSEAQDVQIQDAEGHFTVEFESPAPTHIDVYSPASAWDNTAKPTIPAVQTPSANSVDPKAHILKAENVAVNSGVVTMSHAVAYGKMTVIAPDFEIDHVVVDLKGSYSGSARECSYTINATKVENNTFWFATEPIDVAKFTVKAYDANDNAVAKTVDVAAAGKTLTFNEGHVSTFSVSDLKTVLFNYTLVTDVADLAVGDKVIIVAKDSDVAMSTTQNNNNRGQATVTKIGDIVELSNNVQILTLEAGKTPGTFAFNTGSGYLHAASSSNNYLRTETTLSANSSWSITIADRIATITAQGSYTRKVMQYNQSSSLFACYASASQKALSIYKRVEAGTDEPDQPGEPQPTPLATPVISASVQNNNNIVVTWSEVDAAASYVVTCTDQTDVTVNSDATLSATFEGLDYDTQYTVKVKALPATDDTMHLESGVATKTVTTDSDPNAAPLIADGEYVIIASDARNEAFHALSSEDNGKRLNAVGVTFDSTAAVFETPNTSIIWTIKSTNGSYTISNGSKYLHWDSGNYANTNGTDKSVVKIKESDKEGRYNIVWGGDDTRLLSKNNSENYFAFYQGTQQDDLFIVPAEQGVAQQLIMSALTTSKTSNSITVSWNAVANASRYAVTIDGREEQLVDNDTSYTFTGLTAETSYTISVVAKGDGVYYLDSEPAKATATTLAAVVEPEQPGEGGSDVAEQLVTFDFTNISGFSSWGNSYSERIVEYDDATVIFTSANKQSSTITNMPVTKGQPVEIKAKDGATMKAVKFTCKKWSSKSQTITLHYSTNGGTSYTTTGKTSTNFSIEHTELPAGTNAVKITFSSSGNQVGIQQADVTFLK